MTTSYGDWQPGRLRLSAPELYVLRKGPDATATEVFKLAIQELVGRGVLKLAIRQQGSGRTTTRTILLEPAAHGPEQLRRPLQSIMDAVSSLSAQTSSQSGGGVTIQDVARALRDRHEGDLSEWVTDEVVASLVERRLYVEQDVTRLGLFSTTSREPTPEGKAAQAELEGSIARAEDQFPSWAADEPARAAAFLALAGPAVLLMPDLQPALENLREASPGRKKLMAAGVEPVANIADEGFNVFLLQDASEEVKVLNDVADYGRLDRDTVGEG